MSTIFKYEIPHEDLFSLEIPGFIKVLYVDTQKETPCVWVECDEFEPVKSKGFMLKGTGHQIHEGYQHVGSYQLFDETFVGHLFTKNA